MSDSREQFEDWACKHWPSAAQEIRYKRDALPANHPRYRQYVSNDLQVAWESWQASRKVLEIELPPIDKAEKPYACYEGGWNDMRREAVEACVPAASVDVEIDQAMTKEQQA